MDRRAFTLIELVLALSLAAIVLLVALSSARYAAGLWESGQRTADRDWIDRYFTSVFQAEVASIFPYEGDGGVVFSGKADRVEFVSAVFTEGLPWGGARLVEYAVEDGSLVVKEKTLPYSEGGVSSTTELTREVEGVSFSYLGAAGWVDTWDGAVLDALPKAVAASVLVKGAKKPLQFSMPVMLGSRNVKE
jgi:prepilin-type N-terminal cleavage/methylation domain-containing protein